MATGEGGSTGFQALNVRSGTLILDGDRLSRLQGYIDSGQIVPYDGNGQLQMDYDVTDKGVRTLTAVHNLNPSPPANSPVVLPGEVELSWTFPDPCVPGQPVSVDVYFTDDLNALKGFADPESMRIVSQSNVTSVVVHAELKKQYYWAVDTYIGDPNDPIWGPIFSLIADNEPPRADAGADVVTWLEAGTRVGNLDATVIDSSPYTVQWTVVSEPNDPHSADAAIADPRAEDTAITLSAVGEYVLQLEASDGEYGDSDTITINVYNDSCEAAQSLPDYVPLPGDINGDCIVDQLDLDILNENWLKSVALTDEWSLSE